VYHYQGGKQDWFANDLPREGKAAGECWIGDLTWRAVPTCSLQDRIGDVRARLDGAAEPVCVVVNDERVVLGLLRGRRLVAAGNDTPAEIAMEPGPGTSRPHTPLAQMARQMRKAREDHALVTTGEGRLVGWLSRRAAERELANAGKGNR
jgi:CBS domain-containing protein